MYAGVYAWIGINFVLGRFEHTDDGKWPWMGFWEGLKRVCCGITADGLIFGGDLS